MPETFRRIASILLFVLQATAGAYGQQKFSWHCADTKLTELKGLLEPGYRQMREDVNRQVRDYIGRHFRSGSGAARPITTLGVQAPLDAPGSGDSLYTIPVVVHVVYPAGQSYGSGTNISYGQIRSQIEALNAAFSKTYPAYNGQLNPDYAQDTRIRFCLARTPSGPSSWFQGPGGVEYGVRRYADNSGAYDHLISVASATQLLGITHPTAADFPFDRYLNIWLVQRIDGGNSVMGYAPKPIMAGYPLDGVVLRADIFGDNTTGGSYALGFGLAQGKVLAHEIGHYFDLYHIFQDGCAGTGGPGSPTDACDMYGDLICDIAPSTTQNVLCTGAAIKSCHFNYNTGTINSDMINDYMSYADDDCMNTFTLDQAQRMWATLQLQRHRLWQAENLAATGVLGAGGCIPPYLNASISTNEAVYCSNRPISFSNPLAGNTATSYQWQFPGANPSSGSGNSQTVVYASPGNYKALLTVSDGVNTRSDSMTFTVNACSLDSSRLYMSHWYFGEYVSLDFSTGYPVQTTTALENHTRYGEYSYSGEPLPFSMAAVSLSDSTGKLLFYSNGVSVWNSNHKKMNTSPMFGASDINASSGMCYVPFPGHPGKYFIVGVYPPFSGGPQGVRSVLVDVNANTVQSYVELKNASLPARFSEFLTVVPHCNGTDYWIIVKGYAFYGDYRFYAFQVGSAGIDAGLAPVISSGIRHPGYVGGGNQLKSNRRGDKLILTDVDTANTSIAALYDFDGRTGEIKNEREVPNVAGYSNIQTGSAFSPGGEYFYLMRSTNFATNGAPYWLFQYRVSDLSYNIIPTTGLYFGTSFQAGPDGQLYTNNGGVYLARISDPDNWGGAVFNDQFINLRTPSLSILANGNLPAFIDARRLLPTSPEFSIEAIDCRRFRFSSLCFDNYTARWDFGDGSPVETGSIIEHSFGTSGVYHVRLTLSGGGVDYGTVMHPVTVLPLSAGISGTEGAVCADDINPSEYYAPRLDGVDYRWEVTSGSISGSAGLSYVDVIWNQGGIDGTLTLTMSRDKCTMTAKNTVSISAAPVIQWTLPASACVKDSPFALLATPTGGDYSGDGVDGHNFSPGVAGRGSHSLRYSYRDDKGCPAQATRTIDVKGGCEAGPPPPLYPPGTPVDCNQLLSSIIIANNPVQGDVLQLRSPYSIQYAQVYNMMGQRVAGGNLADNRLQLPYLPQGIYALVVYCDPGMYARVFRFYKL